ncbi:hypothetical protein FZEAL_1524 [Fusarium zealandicum]|uniref:FAD-binding domain-containing protein n=1 Tax=Fusarium zealandicum TaxID=1053134 RepID=A0A8H4UTF5_9HYPO|nr:hypothetical protein FZEAL_1524 [Fusarium zealandicum]
MAPLKVLIVGGGVAGPALAHWLSRTGASITLIERSPQIRASGQQLDLRAQGVPMMKKMGIEPAVRAVGVHETGTQFIDTSGQTKAFFPAVQSGSGRQSITSEYEIMRGDLVHILYGLTETSPNVKHVFNTTVDTLTQDDESDPAGKVHVGFNDGTKQDYDLVVGADGTGSRTRKLMLGPDAPDPRHHQGGYIGFFSIPSKPGDSDRFTFFHLPGRWIGTRQDNPELTRIYMYTDDKNAALDAAHESRDLAELKKAWGDIFQGEGWECDRFMKGLKDAPEADDLYSTPFVQVRLPEGSWSKGRVALIGDAAHSGTANGIGTTWALVGAYILAGEIAALQSMGESSAAVVQGAKNYEARFRPIATALHGQKDYGQRLMAPRSSLGIWLLHSAAKAMAYLQLEQRVGLDKKTASWALPEYPELVSQ